MKTRTMSNMFLVVHTDAYKYKAVMKHVKKLQNGKVVYKLHLC